MQTATALDFNPSTTNGGMDGPDRADALGPMPKLPRARQRWTVRRKAAVIEAVRGGWLRIEDACRVYRLSVDEFLAWERDIDRFGIHGLRSTRLQIYRDTEARKG
jgi:hypothetical protein